jgi:hypothetical protein
MVFLSPKDHNKPARLPLAAVNFAQHPRRQRRAQAAISEAILWFGCFGAMWKGTSSPVGCALQSKPVRYRITRG